MLILWRDIDVLWPLGTDWLTDPSIKWAVNLLQSNLKDLKGRWNLPTSRNKGVSCKSIKWAKHCWMPRWGATLKFLRTKTSCWYNLLWEGGFQTVALETGRCRTNLESRSINAEPLAGYPSFCFTQYKVLFESGTSRSLKTYTLTYPTVSSQNQRNHCW